MCNDSIGDIEIFILAGGLKSVEWICTVYSLVAFSFTSFNFLKTIKF